MCCDGGGLHITDSVGDVLCADKPTGEGIIRGDGGRAVPACLHGSDPLLDPCETVFEEADETCYTW